MKHLPFVSESFSLADLLATLDIIKLKDVSMERDLSYSLRDVIVSLWPDSKVYVETNISDDDRFRYDIIIRNGDEKSVIELAFPHGPDIAKEMARKERLLAEGSAKHSDYSFYILGFVRGSLTGIPDPSFDVHEYASRDGKEYTFIYKLLSGKRDEKPPDKIKEIDSVESILQDIKWSEMSGSVFFRGQWNLDHILLPRALRHPGIEDYEKNLFLEIMTNHPDEYMGQSNLQKLSRMQHDTIPTRLLDVSSNPLVALFFAVSGIEQSKENKSSGWLICFPIDKDDKDRAVQPYNSERCSCLSALVNLGTSEHRMLRYYAVMDYLIQIYSSGLAHDLTEMESSSLFYMIVRDTVRHILTQIVLRGTPDTSSKYYVSKQYEKRIREEVDRLIRAQYSYLGDKRISKYPGCKNHVLISEENGKAGKKPGYACEYHRICNLVLQKCTFDLAHQSVVICSERFSCFPIGTGNIFGITPSDGSWKRWLEFFDKSELESSMLADSVSMDYIYPEMALLHRHITAENPSFGKNLKPLDILDGAFVRPVTNSDRMIAQHGAFMIYGLSRFWKTRRTLDFLIGSRGLSLDDSVSYLVSDDDSFLDDEDRTEHSKRIIEFLFGTAGAEVYTIPDECCGDIRNKLRFLGVSAAAMGRSAETTYGEYNRMHKA